MSLAGIAPDRPRSVFFVVEGVPVTQGSMIALISRSTGRAMVKPMFSAKLSAWRKAISAEAKQAMAGRLLFDGPIAVHLVFHLPRPKTVKREWPDRRLDIDKMTRACLDSLTGVVFSDDSRVCQLEAQKRYAENNPCAAVMVWPL